MEGARQVSEPSTVSSRFCLLAAASLLGMMIFMPYEAEAADLTPIEEQVSPPGPYFSITAAYLFNESDDNLSFDPADSKLGDLEALPPGEDGWLAGVALGAPIDPVWDWKISGHAVWLSESEDSFVPTVGSEQQHASNDLDYQYVDLELGFHPDSMTAHDIRLFAGVRVLHAENDIHYEYEDTKIGNYDHANSILAIGPRMGVDAGFPFADTGPQFITALSGSVLFGRFERDFSFSETGGIDPAGVGSDSSTDHGVIFNLEGLAALRFNVDANSALDIGYRAQHWWNMLDSVFEAESGDGDFEDGGRTDVFLHGPFVTLTVQLP